jgi:hypothetical protein
MKTVSAFEAAILKGLMEIYKDPTRHFGSTMAFSIYCDSAIKAGLVKLTKDELETLVPTDTGKALYKEWGLSKFPDTRATSWPTKVFWLDKDEWRMHVWSKIKHKRGNSDEDQCARNVWEAKKAVLISDFSDNGEDLYSSIKDTLINLRLLCHVLDVDFSELVASSYTHYLREKENLAPYDKLK